MIWRKNIEKKERGRERPHDGACSRMRTVFSFSLAHVSLFERGCFQAGADDPEEQRDKGLEDDLADFAKGATSSA
jgi:hypothetical protein